MIDFANKGKGLGGYINHDFKKKHDYYKLIVLPGVENSQPEIIVYSKQGNNGQT